MLIIYIYINQIFAIPRNSLQIYEEIKLEYIILLFYFLIYELSAHFSPHNFLSLDPNIALRKKGLRQNKVKQIFGNLTP